MRPGGNAANPTRSPPSWSLRSTNYAVAPWLLPWASSPLALPKHGLGPHRDVTGRVELDNVRVQACGRDVQVAGDGTLHRSRIRLTSEAEHLRGDVAAPAGVTDVDRALGPLSHASHGLPPSSFAKN